MIKNSRAKIYIRRELEEKIERFLHSPEIIAIVGARQTGKTTLMGKVFEGVKDDAVFLDFEDREVLSLFQEDVKAFAKLHVEGRKFVFIDEFQYAEEGGRLLKYLYDHYPTAKFIISGSSGLDLTVKAVRYLVGRIFAFELFPFNFTEFLSFKEPNLYEGFYKGWIEDIGNCEEISQPLHKRLMSLWEEFSIWGGYPRVVLSDSDEEKKEVLKGIINTYLLKDIRGFFRLATERHLQRLMKALALQIGNLVHYNELSQASDLPYKALKEHLSILEQTYILRFAVPYYTNKRLEVVKNPKVYFGDTGLRNL
ncbi:MAG: ATP-binding protein, partial [Deltaproteobacteria bacterium]|nr:ATP-binding protein [Deltaproteobacteria bacterium]